MPDFANDLATDLAQPAGLPLAGPTTPRPPDRHSPRAQIDRGERMAAAMVQAGFRHLEVTCDSDRPFELVQRLQRHWPHCWVGLGSLRSAAQLDQGIAAQAAFGFSPALDHALLARAIAQHFP
ncbi:MAG: hypothetical protein HC824_05530 [Synechococcales cyanobacterium RM1_1_8]|nr:hypothetical protein [Synechococcales cyanobacterium RM1_1_8]